MKKNTEDTKGREVSLLNAQVTFQILFEKCPQSKHTLSYDVKINDLLMAWNINPRLGSFQWGQRSESDLRLVDPGGFEKVIYSVLQGCLHTVPC